MFAVTENIYTILFRNIFYPAITLYIMLFPLIMRIYGYEI